MRQKRNEILKWIPVLLCCFIFVLSIYIFKWQFKDTTLMQLLYSLFNSKGTNSDIIFSGVFFTLVSGTILFLFILAPAILFKKKTILKLCVKTKKINIQILPIKHKLIYKLVIIVILLLLTSEFIGLEKFIRGNIMESKIFEENYVDPNDTEIIFPKDKKNLIYIYLESMESTNVSMLNGGGVEKSYIPNLEKLALENINFSNNSQIGGAYQINTASWTIAAMVAQTSGVPLKILINNNEFHGYSSFLKGVTSLGEILKDNGYTNHLMLGSDSNFGGRYDYFSQHGEYEILDHPKAQKMGLIDKDYSVWWGYEDKLLYKFAQDKITELSKEDEPFNFTMLTVDTHFTDGYLDEECETPFETQYANTFHCADYMVNEFLTWLAQQKFYDDTIVIITGDHLTMQSDFYDLDRDYQRTIYNLFINSQEEPIKEKNRKFTTLDMFPTTLAAMGVEIKGNRLGLGTNLFSNERTLVEKIGLESLNDELNKKSDFYNKHFLQNTYYEMLEKSDLKK